MKRKHSMKMILWGIAGAILGLTGCDSEVGVPLVSLGFVRVAGGTFQMGSTDGDDDEKPVHTVMAGDFDLSKYEITVARFREFVQASGYQTDAETGDGALVLTDSAVRALQADANWRKPYFSQSDIHPVVAVSWYDAVQYCNLLSGREGLAPAYTIEGQE